MKGERINTLQAGRALAALSVVAHHAVIAARDFGGAYASIFEYGWIGVDFFFVLSGYIIASSIEGKSKSNYIWHRFRRVYLPYLPIGMGIALAYTLMPNISAGSRNWSWASSLLLIPYGDPALSVAWTLQHEIVFYAIFALAWFTGRLWMLAVWGAFCIFSIPIIPLAPINIDFLLGVSCFYVTRDRSISRFLWVFAAIPFGIWIVMGASRENSLLIGLAFSILLPAIIQIERNGWHVPKFASFLGDASYAIYLIHGIAISVASRVYPNMLFLFIVGLIFGIIYYISIEKQILRYVSKNIRTPFYDTNH